MRLHDKASGRPGRFLLGMTLAGALAVTLAACSSSGTKHAAVTKPSAPSAITAPAAPSTSAPASAPAAGDDLSGTWSGQYSGAYNGTFNLSWQQSGSKLSGTIKISNPADTLSINGAVNNGKISFGTVGSMAITYSGTVSGSSMSGTYQVGGSSGGPWSASKS
ncbi:MAG TPA: hypothetical protein VH637_01390 [Streptosporangiaceae bacterium]|jgi:hypothetical protein